MEVWREEELQAARLRLSLGRTWLGQLQLMSSFLGPWGRVAPGSASHPNDVIYLVVARFVKSIPTYIYIFSFQTTLKHSISRGSTKNTRIFLNSRCIIVYRPVTPFRTTRLSQLIDVLIFFAILERTFPTVWYDTSIILAMGDIVPLFVSTILNASETPLKLKLTILPRH